MAALTELYQTAYLNDVAIINRPMKGLKALSIMDGDGACYIALNTGCLKSEQDEVVVLAHDLGHCMTGAFYNRYSKLNVISQKEYRADRWAVQTLLPPYELEAALADGCTEPWELAEYFDLPEEFVRKALRIYAEILE